MVNGQVLAEPTVQERQQWFEDAGLGLFLHWGIYSVIGGQESWDMVKDYPHARSKKINDPEAYYRQMLSYNRTYCRQWDR